jgi:hypothetical protein
MYFHREKYSFRFKKFFSLVCTRIIGSRDITHKKRGNDTQNNFIIGLFFSKLKKNRGKCTQKFKH